MQRREGSRQAQKRQKLIDAARAKRVAQQRRPPDYPHRWDDAYRLRVGDGQGRQHGWSSYLRRLTERPGWSVAKLARQSGIHRATIFGWIKEGGENVTIASVRLIADAAGDSMENALRAAADITAAPSDPESDPELDAILSAPVSNVTRMKMIRRLFDIREQEKQRHAEEIQRWIREAEAG
ncbi:MAG TPA: helix-turn-helix transcriptional regulator [Jiangellaceae bacterium]|nr:helix-turn-helix transcriptional regulator [Jiangellaceae bacterium]